VFKKVAIGCAIVFVLLAVGGGIGVYWLYSKAKTYVGSLSELGDVAKMEAAVANTAPFEGPASGELAPEQVERFAKLNEQVRATLGPRFEQLKKRYDELEARMKAESRETSPAEAFAAVKDLVDILKEVREAQVTALNAQRMSVAEYRWVRDRVFDAAGIPISVFNVGAFVEAAKSGDVETLTKGQADAVAGSATVPEKNRELVKPLESKLGEWAALAWLGF
jgi:hypothetical protein